MLGTTELLIIFGLALLLFGADRLPKLGRSIGHTIKEFREGQKEVALKESKTDEGKDTVHAGS
ncbi:MAG: twin-arginine translocase TatA/TatE family subunit [Coprothermobacterota bacterium]|nr:twin-arginine translocase TatA/TatE family subunit [Coprothermobacterota bacterium]